MYITQAISDIERKTSVLAYRFDSIKEKGLYNSQMICFIDSVKDYNRKREQLLSALKEKATTIPPKKSKVTNQVINLIAECNFFKKLFENLAKPGSNLVAISIKQDKN